MDAQQKVMNVARAIYVRAEVLANINGGDPNDDEVWKESLSQANDEYNDEILRGYVYREEGGNVYLR